jgi:hypothetical protein
MKRHYVLWVAFAGLVATMVIVAGLLLASATAGNPHATDPVAWDGPWTAQVGEARFEAIVTGNEITITLNMSTTAGDGGLYWKGTFPAPAIATQGSVFDINSTGDTAAMGESLYGSQDPTKVFTFDNGKLTFKFTIAGVRTTVPLEKQDPGV